MELKAPWIVMMTICILLAVMPADASDFTLDIFGNANMDDTIDEQDIEYVQGIIDGTNDETELADANYDGVIDEEDIAQIELIIDGDETELTFIDYDGVVETVHMPVKRIVSTYMYHAWAVEMLGAGDRIIAVDKTVKNEKETVFPSLKDLPNIGSGSEYDTEKILELEPDIVIIYTRKWLTKGSNPNMEKTIETAYPNCTVFALMPRDIGTFKEEMAKLAYILGEKDAGDELMQWYEAYIEDIASRVSEIPEEDKPKVFHVDNDDLLAGGTSYHTYASEDEASNLVIEKAGGINIARDLPGSFIEVEAEWVPEQNPDVIMVSDWNNIGYIFDDPTNASKIRDDLMNRPELKYTNAVKDGRVYLINWYSMVTEWFIGIPYLAKLFYPDEFQDLDPEAIHQEYLTRFRGIDYDLNDHGIFVYPPIEMDDGLAGTPDRYRTS